MKIRALVLYLALGLSANIAASPASADMAEIEAMREGEMRKLIFHATPQPVSGQNFERADGSEGQLADYEGNYVLLNFWATWCPPCRKEMPMLAELQTEFGGENFEVVTLATGRNSPVAMERFFAEIEVDNLPLHRDPSAAIGREMGVFGLPVTVLLTPQGEEIARMTGEADWATDEARALIRALIELPGSG